MPFVVAFFYHHHVGQPRGIRDFPNKSCSGEFGYLQLHSQSSFFPQASTSLRYGSGLRQECQFMAYEIRIYVRHVSWTPHKEIWVGHQYQLYLAPHKSVGIATSDLMRVRVELELYCRRWLIKSRAALLELHTRVEINLTSPSATTSVSIATSSGPPVWPLSPHCGTWPGVPESLRSE